MEILVENIDSLDKAAQEFIAQMKPENRIYAFYGKMGAGKTTFIKALCEALGVEDTVTSPTFAIVNAYESARCGDIFHFDFYRIKRLEEVYDMGFEDYFYSGSYCFIEWPELVEELLPADAVKVTIAENADGTRSITF